jgi:hypothetical protein
MIVILVVIFGVILHLKYLCTDKKIFIHALSVLLFLLLTTLIDFRSITELFK